MGRGQGYGMGMGRKRGKGIMFFLQSCLLVLLHREPSYGYKLKEDLEEFGFLTDEMDISVMYRILRNLEAEGFVSDSWDDKSQGPQRRVYTITSDGEEVLVEWITNLRKRRKEIEILESAYDAVIKK